MIVLLIPNFDFVLFKVGRIICFSDSFPGNKSYERGIPFLSISKPMPIIGVFLCSFEGPFLRIPFSKIVPFSSIRSSSL